MESNCYHYKIYSQTAYVLLRTSTYTKGKECALNRFIYNILKEIFMHKQNYCTTLIKQHKLNIWDADPIMNVKIKVK